MLGNSLGSSVGLLDGTFDITLLGGVLGRMEGPLEGDLLGITDGCATGESEGAEDGTDDMLGTDVGKEDDSCLSSSTDVSFRASVVVGSLDNWPAFVGKPGGESADIMLGVLLEIFDGEPDGALDFATLG